MTTTIRGSLWTTAKMKTLLLLALVLLAAVAPHLAAVNAAGVTATTKPTMYVFGDLHYDPFYGTIKAISDSTMCQQSNVTYYASMPCDTSPTLMESAIADIFAQAAVDGDGIMVITGDFLRHRMSDFDIPHVHGKAKHAVELEIAHNITASIGNTIAKYQSLYPNTRMHLAPHPNLFTLVTGNEDCVPNYEFYVTLNATAHPSLPYLTSAMVETGLMSQVQADQFGRCAFYATSPTGTNLVIIGINTVIYSKEHTPNTSTTPDPCGQFAWLEGQLNSALLGNKRVILLGHIIPQPTKWYAEYLDTFIGLMKNYGDTISSQWFGHTHMFTFLTESGSKAPPLFDVPGITPRDGNMPAYLKVTFTDQSEFGPLNTSQWLVDQIQQRFLNTSGQPESTAVGWQTGMSFPSDFSQWISGPLTTSNLYAYADFLLKEKHSSEAWLQFERFYFGGVVQPGVALSHKKKAEVLCKASTHSESDYQDCKKKYQ